VLLLRFLKGPGALTAKTPRSEALAAGISHLIDQVRTGRWWISSPQRRPTASTNREKAQRAGTSPREPFASALYFVVVPR